jgi:hypothetical protein
VTFGVGAPEIAGELVERMRVRSAGCGGDELFGEHGSPIREPAMSGRLQAKTTSLTQ